MNVIKSKGGYYFKIYKNGKKKRISKKEYLKLKNNKYNFKKGGELNKNTINKVVSICDGLGDDKILLFDFLNESLNFMYLFNKSNNERSSLKRHNKIIEIEQLYQPLLDKLTSKSDKDFLSYLHSIIFSYSPKSNEETNENIENIEKLTEILQTISSIIDNTFVFEENQLKTMPLGINANQVSSKKLLQNGDYVLVTNKINDYLTQGVQGKVRETIKNGYIIDFNQPYNQDSEFKNEMHYKGIRINLDKSVKCLQKINSKKLLENDDYVLVTNKINDMLTKGIQGKVREKKNNVREKITNGYIINFNQPYNPPLQYKNEMHYKGRHISLDTSVKYLQKISGPFKTFFFWKLLYNQLSPLKYNEEILSDTKLKNILNANELSNHMDIVVELSASCIRKNLFLYNNKGLIFKFFKFNEKKNELYHLKFEQERYINTYLANIDSTHYVVKYYGDKITEDGVFLMFEHLQNRNLYQYKQLCLQHERSLSRQNDLDEKKLKIYIYIIEMCKMMFCIIRGINYCHKNDLSHCDIKPENFGISNNELKVSVVNDIDFTTLNCKIIDFGSAFTKISIMELLKYYQSSKQDKLVLQSYLDKTLEIVGSQGFMSENAAELLYDFKKFIFIYSFNSDKIEVLAEYALNILKINDFYATMITFLTILTSLTNLSTIPTDLERFKSDIITNSLFDTSLIHKFVSNFLEKIHNILMKIVNCNNLSLSSIELNNYERVLNEKISLMTNIISELNNDLNDLIKYFITIIIKTERLIPNLKSEISQKGKTK